MNGFDLTILAIAALAAFGGFRLGFLKRSIGWVGAALGLGLAFVILPSILEQYEGEEGPRLFLISAAVLLSGVLVGQGAGLLAARSVRLSLPPPFQLVDRVAGALLAAVIVLVAIWLLLPIMKAIPTWPSEQAESSAIAGAMDRTLPAAPDALGGLGEVIEELAFPTVFSDPGEAPEAADPPADSPLSPAAEDTLSRSVVRVSGVACGFVQQGSGFVVEPGVVMTNAHVVAGHGSTDVELPGSGRVAGRVVLFDPETDVALIAVDLAAPPLELAEPVAGEQGLAAGFPDGGPLEGSPFELADRVQARGTDIYGRAEVVRDVLVLAVDLEPGDSGAPVVNGAGAVIGLAFAVDPDAVAVAYALSEAELRSALAAPRAPVSTGPCAGAAES